MPAGGRVPARAEHATKVALGFATAIPRNCLGVLCPRSGIGAKTGLALNNTVGLIDPDYTGEWFAYLRVHNNLPFKWDPGERILQFFIVPVVCPDLIEVGRLENTERGDGGFGSTGSE